MRHPDEGMIHSWLDGALSAEDAANIESHVAGCQQCAAALAEARGFIAASSRILTALDDVPRGVIPVVPAQKRNLGVFWRAAAAMLVVAGGSLVVLREGGQDTAVRLTTDSATASLESATSNATANSTVGEGAGIAEDAAASAEQSKMLVPSPRRAAPTTAISDRSKGTVGRASTNEQDFSGKAAGGRTGGTVVGGAAPTIAADMAAPPSTVTRASEFRAPAEGTSLKLLSVERRIGESRTTYQVAPTETVTLIESQAVALSEVVTTGASTRQRTGGVSPLAAQAAAPPPPRPAPMLADSQRGRDSATLPRESAAAGGKSMQLLALPIVVVQPNSISWTEAATGIKLTLSGNVSVERLEEIKLSIEQERAATRAKVP